MTTYIITECTTGEILLMNCVTVLDESKIYSFVEKPGECWSVRSRVPDFDQPVYVPNVVYEDCISCKGTDSECSTIIEDDFSVTATVAQKLNEKLLSIRSSIVISNGVQSHTLFSYDIPLPQNYVAGYLDFSEIIPMEWENTMPASTFNGFARLVASMGQLSIQLPTVINWRNFQSLPQLSAIFGVDATNNWLWYQQNGWTLSQEIETQNEVGVYVDSVDFVVRDYDDNASVDWTWEFYRLSDNVQLSAPISNEKVRVYIKGGQTGTPNAIENAVVTVEGIDNSVRWMISSSYNSKTNSPLQPLTGETKLKMIANPNDFELEFVFDPSKMTTQNGVKFTGRSYSGNGYSERNVIDFPVARIPQPPLKDEFESDCCDCKPELKLASLTSEELIHNDISGFAHKRQITGDTCDFKIYKEGQLLTNNGVNYAFGFPYDSKVSAFIYNWKWYLVNHGQGCYKIEKHYTVAGLPIVEELGKYELLEYTPENAKGTTRVLYQNNFQTLWDENTINYTDSGFEDSYRFRGMFGNWQPNVQSESNFSVLNENRVASIKSKDTYILNHFHATECHINRLHKIVMHATIWRMSDHNPSNTLQEKKIYECVLDPEAKEQIDYNVGSRVTGIEVILSKRQQNSVSLFGGSVQVPQGATWLLPTVTGGGGGVCPNGTVTITDNNDVVIGTQTVPSGGSGVFKVVDLPCALPTKEWVLQWKGTTDVITMTATAGNIATFTSQTSSNTGAITVSTDGVTYVPLTYPFTPVVGDYWFKRATKLVTGILNIIE